MPEEFYGYAERQAGSQVNWAKIGQDMSNTLEAEAKDRERRKAEIDAATQKSLTTLSEAPRGTAEDGNKFTIDYAHDATESLLLANRLMKAGKMSVRDYALLKTNIDSGTTQLFNLQKEYQKYFAEKKARMESNDPKNKSQALEYFSQGWMEPFGDFSKSKAVINPMTGVVSAGIMEKNKDGVLELSKDVRSVQDLYKSLGQKYNYFPSADAADAIAKPLGDVVIEQIKAGSLNEKGEIVKYDDPLQRLNAAWKDPNTEKALNDAIDSFLNVPTNVSSILTEDIKKGTYYPVRTEAERDKDPEHAIFCRVNNQGTYTPEFTDKQKQVAFDYLKGQVLSRIHQKVDKEVFEPQALAKAKYDLDNYKAHKESSSSSSSNEPKPLGQSWHEWVDTRVPTIGTGKLVNERFIQEANKNLAASGLKFVSEGPTSGETVQIVDNAWDPPRTSPVYDLHDPKSRDLMIDYIKLARAGQAKDLVGVGEVDKKNVAPSGGRGKKSIPGF